MNDRTRQLLTLQFEVNNLIGRYTHALDEGRVADVVAMFVADCVFDAAIGECANGRSELTDYFARQQVAPEWRPFLGGQHLNTNTVIYAEAPDIRACTDFIYVVPTEDGPAVKFLGRYDDTIRRLGEELKFVRRKVTANPCLPEVRNQTADSPPSTGSTTPVT